jgi:hypothetical protein
MADGDGEIVVNRAPVPGTQDASYIHNVMWR